MSRGIKEWAADHLVEVRAEPCSASSMRPLRTSATPRERHQWLERHRPGLKAHCHRLLRSEFDAEDAVQEALVRAWRNYERFRGRGSLRSWLYSIATNVCFDIVRRTRSRTVPVDLRAASPTQGMIDAAQTDRTRSSPIVGHGSTSTDDDPAERVAKSETVRLALVAALQLLPPRQRAVLFLREVLRWKASEVAELLGTTVASVNSSLQRARATLTSSQAALTDHADPLDQAQREQLARYIDALDRYDVGALASLVSLEGQRIGGAPWPRMSAGPGPEPGAFGAKSGKARVA
jgi:RNA polymerase sigma-70 factor (ECF subfamily)